MADINQSAPAPPAATHVAEDGAGHNAGPQEGVKHNPDPLLEYPHEHLHPHTNHSAAAAKHLDSGVAYASEGKPDHATVPLEHKGEMGVTDAEKNSMPEDDEPQSIWSQMWAKYKWVWYLVVWLLFTGSVSTPELGPSDMLI
jgi:hypothetical protein